MSGVTQLHLGARDAGRHDVQLEAFALCGETGGKAERPARGGHGPSTGAWAGRAGRFTDLLESEGIPRAFSSAVLCFSIRREKSWYRLSTAVTHFFISAAWAWPLSQKPSASCINSFTLSLVCCKQNRTEQRGSAVKRMNPTASSKSSGEFAYSTETGPKARAQPARLRPRRALLPPCVHREGRTLRASVRKAWTPPPRPCPAEAP